jgi:hypothetical protein
MQMRAIPQRPRAPRVGQPSPPRARARGQPPAALRRVRRRARRPRAPLPPCQKRVRAGPARRYHRYHGSTTSRLVPTRARVNIGIVTYAYDGAARAAARARGGSRRPPSVARRPRAPCQKRVRAGASVSLAPVARAAASLDWGPCPAAAGLDWRPCPAAAGLDWRPCPAAAGLDWGPCPAAAGLDWGPWPGTAPASSGALRPCPLPA